MYSEDNNDWLVPNNPPNYGGPDGKPFATWAMGDMRYGNPDGTNIDYVIGKREGSLGLYVKTHKIFSDARPIVQSTKLGDGKSYPRVRSYCMNGFIGTRVLDNGGSGAAATFLRREEFAKAASAGRPELLVFAAVHEDFLDWCIFRWTVTARGNLGTTCLPAVTPGAAFSLIRTDTRKFTAGGIG